jgi:hypothetical protein
MQAVTTIGLDIAKSVFQIHGIDATGNVIVRRQLKRRYVLPFLIPKPPEYVSQFWDRCSLFPELVIPAWPVHADQKPRTRPVRAKFPHGVLGRIAETDRATGHRSVRHSAPVRPSVRVLPLR